MTVVDSGVGFDEGKQPTIGGVGFQRDINLLPANLVAQLLPMIRDAEQNYWSAAGFEVTL